MPWRRRHFSLVKMTWTVKRRLSRTHVPGLLALALLLTVLLCFSRRDWLPGRSGPRENPLAFAIRGFRRPRVDSGQNSSSLLKENGYVAAAEPSLSLSTQGHVMGPGDATSAPLYRYILNQPLKCKDRAPFLVLLVVAEPGQFDARNAIRQTWGNESAVAGQSFVRLFLLGKGNSALQSRIEEESRTHGDIIQQDYQDTYKNLTIKTLMGMNWVATFCPNVSYVMKTDSDMFVNTERLIQELLRPDLPPKQRFFTGYLMRGYAPHRNKDSKWFMAPELYPSERYPPFCLGAGYVFSGDMAGRIYGASRGVPLLPIEDVYVGVCLARLGIAPQPPPNNFLFHNWRVSYSSCTYRRLITSHSFQPGELLTYWRRLQADKHHACADTG